MSFWDWFKRNLGTAEDFSAGLQGNYWQLAAQRRQQEQFADQYAGILGQAPTDTGGPEGFMPGSGFLGQVGANVGGMPTMGQMVNFGAQVAGIQDDTYQQMGLGIMRDIVQTRYRQEMQNQRQAMVTAENRRSALAKQALDEREFAAKQMKWEAEAQAAGSQNQNQMANQASKVLSDFRSSMGTGFEKQVDDVRRIAEIMNTNDVETLTQDRMTAFDLLRRTYRLSSPEALNMGDQEMMASMEARGGQWKRWLKEVMSGQLTETDLAAIKGITQSHARPLLERGQAMKNAAQATLFQQGLRPNPMLEAYNFQMPQFPAYSRTPAEQKAPPPNIRVDQPNRVNPYAIGGAPQ